MKRINRMTATFDTLKIKVVGYQTTIDATEDDPGDSYWSGWAVSVEDPDLISMEGARVMAESMKQLVEDGDEYVEYFWEIRWEYDVGMEDNRRPPL